MTDIRDTAETVGSRWRSGPERAATVLDEIGPERFVARDFRPGILRHIVLIRFRPTALAAEAAEVVRRFLALADECVRDGRPYIESIETGPQLSIEGAGEGFDRAFLLTFSSEGDLHYYLGRPAVQDPTHWDPAHDVFKEFVGPFVDTAGIVAFDFRPEAH
ncbi:Dabb family protein [Rathayibacter rathayi]|uniref:Dabb family protein n=1 Tax=Rathayibacter rathayi TaxID=33887 RepID=A0ABD6WBN5_RATRA|nr:Dabb family protein [Rathayibacter rathayi]AZZ47919.1 Dabb family protein [Rathayibacter rathayi]MWV74821.1 Dabb family protein [Rathayibacter rathayi NCPPB 2980 = VKM Ac-1601]PPF15567.1 Dabb family protein [Rathayibacter rathayi]PPF26015.1 Dabb family protein [Rathayibacter rathayi]PPF51292.1 Dabb family protein [Rathayibacter rathayi]